MAIEILHTAQEDHVQIAARLAASYGPEMVEFLKAVAGNEDIEMADRVEAARALLIFVTGMYQER